MRKSEKILIGTGLAGLLVGFVGSLLYTRKKEDDGPSVLADTNEFGTILVRLSLLDKPDLVDTETRVLVPVNPKKGMPDRFRPTDLSHGLKQWRTLVKKLLEMERLMKRKGTDLK